MSDQSLIRGRQLAALAFVAVYALVPNARAARDCRLSFSPAAVKLAKQSRVEAEADFWAEWEPVTIPHIHGEMPITFSFDSEVTPGEVFRHVLKNPAALTRLESVVSKTHERVSNNPNQLGDSRSVEVKPFEFRRDYLSYVFGMSDAQFNAFALRKRVDRSRQAFFPTDLNPSYFTKIIDEVGRGEKFRTFDLLRSLTFELQVSARALGLPVMAEPDDLRPEMKHLSSEQKPAQFKRLISTLHREFQKPQTHLHVGLPAAAVSPEEAISIARVVETKIILQFARRWDPATATPLAYQEYTSLDQDAGVVSRTDSRGLIRLGIDEFSSPVLAHNLEIRQWETIEDGLNSVYLAASVALRGDYSRFPKKFKVREVQDPFTVRLNGALRFAAFIFDQSPKSEDRLVATRFSILADQIDRAGRVTDEARAMLREMINQEALVDRYLNLIL